MKWMQQQKGGGRRKKQIYDLLGCGDANGPLFRIHFSFRQKSTFLPRKKGTENSAEKIRERRMRMGLNFLHPKRRRLTADRQRSFVRILQSGSPAMVSSISCPLLFPLLLQSVSSPSGIKPTQRLLIFRTKVPSMLHLVREEFFCEIGFF